MQNLLRVLAGFFVISLASADMALKPITDLSEFSGAKNANKITWNNQRPEQQRALNQFYSTMTPTASPRPSIERQQHVQQLRSMTPQQRQQMFLNYIQQNR